MYVLCTFLLLLALLCPLAVAQERTYRVPFHTVNGMILLDATVNDRAVAALNRAANCLEAARLEWEEAIAQREAAEVARWLIENRRRIPEQASRTVESKTAAEFPGEVSITANNMGLDALLGPETPKPNGTLEAIYGRGPRGDPQRGTWPEEEAENYGETPSPRSTEIRGKP